MQKALKLFLQAMAQNQCDPRPGQRMMIDKKTTRAESIVRTEVRDEWVYSYTSSTMSIKAQLHLDW